MTVPVPLGSLTKMVEAQVVIFEDHKKYFSELCQVIIATLENGTKNISGSPIVHGRVKATDSFAEKCIRKKDKYHMPAWQLTDLCGVRVIVLSKNDLPPVEKFIEDSFIILEKEDTRSRLKEMEFGYRSLHYIVSLDPKKRKIYSTERNTISKELFLSRKAVVTAKNPLPVGPIYKAEIQVKTLLQHAWSAAIHDNLYKTEMKNKPDDLVRESALVAALLEDSDNSIVRLMKGTIEYRSYYGAYMTPEEIKNEISIQKIVLNHNPDNQKVALKIARLVDCLDEKTKSLLKDVEKNLARFEKIGDPDILRELGMVRCKLGKTAKGRENLVKSTSLNPNDPDSWCELGLTFFENKDYYKALGYYAKAYDIASDYPRALMRFIECKLLHGGVNILDFVSLIKDDLERAIITSKNKIAVGVHIPYAWYDIGFFSLLLARIDDSLNAYGKAILTTSSPKVVKKVYDSLTGIHQQALGKDNTISKTLKIVRSFLRVILVGRFGEKPSTYLKGGDENLNGLSSLSACQMEGRKSPFGPQFPIVIVAGSCSSDSQQIVESYAPLLKEAFKDYAGIVCCGGTESGISGIIGHLDNNKGQIKKIGYLPKNFSNMREYECIHSADGDFNDFSQLESLLLWGDILLSGVSPKYVRVLGVRGGSISLFELQLGLLLGAKVGIFPESGGACGEIDEDPEWSLSVPFDKNETIQNGKRNLLRLPPDVETLRSFLHIVAPSTLINAEIREKIAQEIHAAYRKSMMEKAVAGQRNMAPWKELDATFRNANLGMIDHIDAKLKRVNLTLQKISDRQPRIYKFKTKQVLLLAEMEHGRWVIDRLEDGWTLGVRDDKKKTRPQIVPWNELSDEEKNKDINSIQELPKILAASGYEIIIAPVI